MKALEKSISTGTWHISGTIKIKEKYNKVSKTGKTYIYIYYKEERDGIIYIIRKKGMESFIKVIKMKLLMYLERV